MAKKRTSAAEAVPLSKTDFFRSLWSRVLKQKRAFQRLVNGASFSGWWRIWA